MDRREFLQTGVGAATTLGALHTGAYAAGKDTTLRVGLIGCGWYGKTDLFHLMQVAPVDVVGLCDVDQQAAQHAAELVAGRQPSGKQPPLFGDYRKLLSEQKPEIVLIGTPDHWHCLPMVEACKAGIDVYVQKPISYDVVEGQAMVAAARKYNRTVQVGLQRRSTPHLLEARDRYVRSGKLGKVAAIDIHSYYGGPREYAPVQAPPTTMDWEMYVGPADWRDYRPNIHPRAWRSCREFSNGQTGDLCVHLFDLVRFYFDLGWPNSIAATGGTFMRSADTNVNVHDTQTAIFDYDDLQIVWNQRNWGENPEPDYPWAVTLYGDKGTLKISVWQYTFIPRGGGSPVTVKAVEEREQYPEDVAHKETELFAAPATRAHMRNFLEARQEKKRPVADIEHGHISSAVCIMANLSMELGRGLVWDAEHGRVKNDDEANQRLARTYRGDWVHPTPDNV
ncbi:MAG: Gfo/Idh/MocA family oxidoreductase [Planctomycetales bacterium]|nr:Gfo/Idh/MocA family oxidoreductase [Planctomycetales bacterium]MCA9166809.1 Gfo/Idh/MocA family oxidoreductase [Planctomycetales bacterium]